jgi:hypothetical protein
VHVFPPKPAEACSVADRQAAQAYPIAFRATTGKQRLMGEDDEFRVPAGFPAESLVSDHQG